MKPFKTKSGFTLIELLVVIGILAVLAAIAIPSVAGLIDRANVSADTTNANEMTNAFERFASEYELFRQDLASGVFDKANMDSTQSRVYNVLKVEDRTGIEQVEVDDDVIVTEDQIAIFRDTKYPANAKTARAIVQNYTKTSSSTFEPKQSDMHYWYSPNCGVVVVSEPNSSKTTLNALIVSGMDAKGNTLSEETHWIDITLASYEAGNDNKNETPSNIIPSGGTYYVGVTSFATGDYTGATVYTAGQPFPDTVTDGDVYTYGSYEYRYNQYYYGTQWVSNSQSGWGVRCLYDTATPGPILESINNVFVTNMYATFMGYNALTNAPAIPSGVTDMTCAFAQCKSLQNAPDMSNATSLTNMSYAFYDCYALTGLSMIPNGVTSLQCTFYYCTSLKNVPSIPNSVTNMYNTFTECVSLTKAPIIPSSVVNMEGTFWGCIGLTGTVTINATPTSYGYCFYNVNFKTQSLTLTGTSSNLATLGKTGKNY